MPPLDNPDTDIPGQAQAIMAESLYLVNLLLLPGIAFLLLLNLYFRMDSTIPALARCHIKQSFIASVWAGFLIIVVSSVILLFGSFEEAWTWVVLIIYFTTIHSTLVLLGVLGLSRALAGKHFHYPLIGVQCDDA
ncbi:MAG: hypothetical protein EP315_00915 [Gammaproteobacteria bacterium]|nr:MAG: hypothetical protein EP315_00915 [Gammaproteobacteria bacterium]